MIDPIAVRVAHRHGAAVVLQDGPLTSARVEFACDGTVSTFWLKMALEPMLGYVRTLRFRSPDRPAPAIRWEAVTGNGQVVAGTLVLKAAVTARAVQSWAEVTLDPTP